MQNAALQRPAFLKSHALDQFLFDFCNILSSQKKNEKKKKTEREIATHTFPGACMSVTSKRRGTTRTDASLLVFVKKSSCVCVRVCLQLEKRGSVAACLRMQKALGVAQKPCVSESLLSNNLTMCAASSLVSVSGPRIP